MKRTRRGLVVLFACVALLSLLLAACGDEEGDAGEVGDAPLATSTPATGTGQAETSGAGDAEAGRAIWQEQCATCHTLDGSEAIGPTWQGLWMSEVPLEDGSTVTADEAYITESIREPNAKIHEGFAGVMPELDLDDDEIASVIAFIQTLE